MRAACSSRQASSSAFLFGDKLLPVEVVVGAPRRMRVRGSTAVCWQGTAVEPVPPLQFEVAILAIVMLDAIAVDVVAVIVAVAVVCCPRRG